ncbi:MAG: hypothetical protein DBY17_05140 [Oscillospiraceae bacterium]|nr:MAG: hypothetical protein DBY17_05140 [Oscillospiraceae bacterium]
MQLASRSFYSAGRFFHYIILFTLSGTAGGCRFAKADQSKKSRAAPNGAARLLVLCQEHAFVKKRIISLLPR